MVKKVIKCGIMPKEDYVKRTIAIAKGKYKPKRDEPKVWFESPQAMGQVLCRDNIELLKIIIEKNPPTMRALADASGRAKSNLSRSLKTLEKYGIVELRRQKRGTMPVVMATDFDFQFGISSYYPLLLSRNEEKSVDTGKG